MFQVHLQAFEGPLDLLLFFIRRDELDIHDIPIARITDEFLTYVRFLEEIDLDGAADFIYLAAVLISIKARMLLPAAPAEDDEEPVDPRRELVERLLEYVRYKEAAGELAARFEQRAACWVRGARDEAEAPPPSYGASVFELVSALRRVLRAAPEPALHTVVRAEYTIEGQQRWLLEQLRAEGRRLFTSLTAGRAKHFIIATFLGLLELAREGALGIALDRARGDFWVELRADGAKPVDQTYGSGAALSA